VRFNRTEKKIKYWENIITIICLYASRQSMTEMVIKVSRHQNPQNISNKSKTVKILYACFMLIFSNASTTRHNYNNLGIQYLLKQKEFSEVPRDLHKTESF